jgi:DNA-binding NtrC family response regulator
MPLKQLELQAITDALQECGGNKSQAAKKLGISRKTFYMRLKNMPPPRGGCAAS